MDCIVHGVTKSWTQLSDFHYYISRLKKGKKSYDHMIDTEKAFVKIQCWRIYAFELWCWRRLLRVPWTARRSNQSILTEISPEYSLAGLMLKLELWYFGHLMWRTVIGKDPDLGKIEGRRRRGWQMLRWLDSITDLMDLSLSKHRELVFTQ